MTNSLVLYQKYKSGLKYFGIVQTITPLANGQIGVIIHHLFKEYEIPTKTYFYLYDSTLTSIEIFEHLDRVIPLRQGHLLFFFCHYYEIWDFNNKPIKLDSCVVYSVFEEICLVPFSLQTLIHYYFQIGEDTMHISSDQFYSK